MEGNTDGKKGGTGSLGYRILCLRISSGMRIRATVVRLAHAKPKKTNTGNRLPIAGLMSDSTQKKGKHGTRMPITGLISAPEPTNPHWKPTANRWTYVGLQAHNKRIRNDNRWSYIHLLTHTKDKTKGAPGEISSSPAYVPHLA